MVKSPVPLSKRPRSGPYAGLNVNSARRFLTKQFEQAGFADCEAEARDLVMAATGLSRTELVTCGTEFMTPEAFNAVQDYSARRLSGEPVDNILGWREFYGRRFKVSVDVLSPRQETEELVAKTLELIAGRRDPTILDLGTGSGAIAVTLAAEREDARVLGADLSEAALSIAAHNAAQHGVSSRLSFTQSDWFENIDGPFDIIVSNPPYIDAKAMADMPQDVAHFDPELALHGGEDGLDAYRLIARQAPVFMNPDGWLVFEIGYDQGESVPKILRGNGFAHIAVFKDIFGQPRIVTAQI